MSSSGELALQRAQFAQIATQLHSAEEEVRHEVLSSRLAWPPIANGLPEALPPRLRQGVHAASVSAEALREPPFLRNASKLTGPAAGIAGLYESYERLAQQGWHLTEASIASIVGGTPAVASFERQNSPLYIDSIYDGHFDLSLLGEHLASGYEKLGGANAFGAALTQSGMSALTRAYSIAGTRLSPHPSGAAKDG